LAAAESVLNSEAPLSGRLLLGTVLPIEAKVPGGGGPIKEPNVCVRMFSFMMVLVDELLLDEEVSILTKFDMDVALGAEEE
jgi:hypothetical protein